MNFWATIEHSLNYKYKKQLPDVVRDKLKRAADAAFELDELMLDIKDEIKDAQRLFEIKSDIITNIMNNILTLKSFGKTQEANRFENSLNKLVEDGEINELNNLLVLVKREVKKYRD